MKPVSSKLLVAAYQQARSQGLAFVSYRLPGQRQIYSMAGTAGRSMIEGESAFVFAPFEPDRRPYYIRPQSETRPIRHISAIDTPISQKSTTKKEFIDLVKLIVSEINTGTFKKIVAARVLSITKPQTFEPLYFFEKLCVQYPAAFVSLTAIPGVGIWIGASPEVLVAETPTRLTTYSLAGTKVIDDPTDWSDKEREEQQIVTDFIYTKLEKIISEKISVQGPATHTAGRIKHLLSVFTILHRGNTVWRQVVKALHPTPAVAGMPKHKALRFVSTQESFDRAFYAGYLGPVDQQGKTNLFVNLRCMQVTDTQLLFYAGCGITADSDPQKEWLESERKIDILKSLL